MLHRFHRTIPCLAILMLLSGCALTGQDDEHRAAPLRYVEPPQVVATGRASPAPDIVQASFTQKATDVKAEKIAAPKTDGEQSIDLAGALRRAGAANPVIALAQEAVTASRAEWLQARALLLPTLNAGANYRMHNGALQNSLGIIRDVNSESLYFGGGAEARGSGTVVVPAVRLVSHLGNALLEPQAARLQLVGRLRDADAVQQQIILEVAVAHLSLCGAQASLESLHQTRRELDEIVRVTANFAKAGQGRDGDAQRARSELHLLEVELDKTREQQAVAAANLARLLHLDPSTRLIPAEETPPVVEWVDPATPLEALLAQAVAGRPEIAAQAARVGASEVKLRQERVRPWAPTIAVGFSAGEFGGGGGIFSRFDRFQGRTNFDAMAFWTLQNLGFGNHALQNRAQGQLQRAEAEQRFVVDEVRRQVSDALALAQARSRDVEIARKRIVTSREGYQQDLTRTRNAEGRPIEVLSSLNQLNAARLDFIRALVGSSQAQFQLAVALGRPAAVNFPGKSD